jgi:rod shape-determining protein MreC
MRNLILLFTRYGHVILLLIFQLIGLSLIINYNQSQKEIWVNSVNLFTGNINKNVQKLTNYGSLQEKNDSLARENALLQEKIINFRVFDKSYEFKKYESDSSLQDYKLIPVNICSKTTHLRNNYITLCSGKEDGLRERMGIITKDAVLGITTLCNDSFCKAMLVNNSLTKISGIVKTKNYSGKLVWRSLDPRILTMTSVPRHANIELGDTILTSGYSTMFPYGIPVGIITSYDVIEGQNEYEIEVTMLEDPARVDMAYAVDYEFSEKKDSVITQVLE